jgi:hypothetical protein
MKNPFTSETKGNPITLDNGVVGALRFQPTIKARILAAKPGHLTLGDFALKAMYDSPFIAGIVAGEYAAVTTALVADWGCPCHGRSGEVAPATSVAKAHVGSAAASKPPLAKASGH